MLTPLNSIFQYRLDDKMYTAAIIIIAQSRKVYWNSINVCIVQMSLGSQYFQWTGNLRSRDASFIHTAKCKTFILNSIQSSVYSEGNDIIVSVLFD